MQISTLTVGAVRSRTAVTARVALVLLTSSIVTLLWLFPLVHHMGSSVLSQPNDATTSLRGYWLAAHEHKSPFTLRWDNYLDAPEGVSAQRGVAAANAVQPAFVWSLRHLLGLVAAWNLFVIAGFVLSATSTYLLLRRLGEGRLAATFGAYVFAFNTYMFEKATAGHAGLVQTWVFPLLVMLLLELRRRPRASTAAFIGLGVALASYLHNYYGLIAGFLVAVAYAVALGQDRSAAERRRTALFFLVSIGAAAACLVPAAIGLSLDRTTVTQYSHPTVSLQQFGSRPLAFLVPAKGNPFLGWILSSGQRTSLEHSGEPTLFFGWTTILLAALAVVMLLKRRWAFDRATRNVVVTAALLIPLAYYMSLPRLIDIGPISVPAGSWFLGHVTTVFRVYARFAILVGLGLVVLASLALDAVVHRFAAGRAIGAAAIAIVAAELVFQLPIHTWSTARVPAYDRYLATQPRGIVAFYPAPNGSSLPAGEVADRELWFQTYTNQKLFFSKIVTNAEPRTAGIRDAALSLTEPWVPGLLAAEGVKYVGVDERAYRASGMTIPKLDTSILRPEFRSDGITLFRLRAKKADIERTLRQHAVQIGQAMWGFQANANYAGPNYYGNEERNGVFWRWMRQDGAIHIENINPGDHILQFHAFSANFARTLTITGPHGQTIGVVKVPTYDTGFNIGPFALPGGSYDLTLHADPGPAPLGASDPRIASIYLSPLTLLPYADFSRVR